MREADFEYDEDTEASDELAYEAADEFSVEGDEDTGEGDEGSDEASDEATDEYFTEAAGDEGAGDESEGEADEAVDEAVAMSASARLLADAARNRQEKWARQIAADQRLEAQRAATTQRTITDQLRSVRPGGRTKVYSVGTLQGAGVVTAILPNGRQSRMRIIPTMAPVSEVNRLRQAIIVNDKRQATATSNNSRAIGSLATAQAAAVKKLTEQQVKSDKDLAKRLVEGDNRLDKRITKELSGGTGVLDKHGKRMMRVLRRQRQRSLMNGVLVATAMPFFAAYGSRESPFTANNAILTGSLLGWLAGDELLDMFGGKSGFARGGATAWSYLAPFANAGTVYFLLRNKQHVRFVSDIATPTAALAPVKVDLTKYLAKDAIDDFFKNQHSVVATASDGSGVTATIDINAKQLTLTPLAGAPLIAWILDTQTAPKIALA